MTDAERLYGSDIAVTALAGQGIEYVALNPGASFRGLHESLVHQGTIRPVMCLEESVAVAIAHGYAKSAGRPMGVFLHNIVGLQRGSIGLFNAWIDQVPIVACGGSGPADRSRRRPYMDWIHSANPQVDIVRNHIKWDDEPVTVAEWPESIARAVQVAVTPPGGPVYVALDALLQEEEATAPPRKIGPQRTPRVATPEADIDRIVEHLDQSDRPLIIADYLGRSETAFAALIELAEISGARVVDLGGRLNFPNTHPNDATGHRIESLRDADLVLALDVRDLRWAVTQEDVRGRGYGPVVADGTPIISIGLEAMETRRVSDREGVVDGAERYLGDTGVVLSQIVRNMRARSRRRSGWPPVAAPAVAETTSGAITRDHLAAMSWEAVRDGPWQLAHGELKGVVRRHWRFERFGQHIGGSGGGGLGYGPGATIGAALANRDNDTLVVAHQTDGDLLYTPSALWTAAHESLPLLMIVVNNRSYGQDRMHQMLMSSTRGRPESHASVGIDITDPDWDFAKLAEAQGVEGFGPVTDPADLRGVLSRAAHMVRNERRPILVEVLVP